MEARKSVSLKETTQRVWSSHLSHSSKDSLLISLSFALQFPADPAEIRIVPSGSHAALTRDDGKGWALLLYA